MVEDELKELWTKIYRKAEDLVINKEWLKNIVDVVLGKRAENKEEVERVLQFLNDVEEEFKRTAPSIDRAVKNILDRYKQLKPTLKPEKEVGDKEPKLNDIPFTKGQIRDKEKEIAKLAEQELHRPVIEEEAGGACKIVTDNWIILVKKREKAL